MLSCLVGFWSRTLLKSLQNILGHNKIFICKYFLNVGSYYNFIKKRDLNDIIGSVRIS